MAGGREKPVIQGVRGWGGTGTTGTRVLKSRHFTNEHTPPAYARFDARSTGDRLGRPALPRPERQITPASADASFRRYFRLTWPDGGTRILMDAPPEEDCKPFIHVAGLLAKADLAAPRISTRISTTVSGAHRPRPHRLPRRPERRPVAGRPADPARCSMCWSNGSSPPTAAAAALRRHAAAP